MNKDKLKSEYLKQISKYERLAKNLSDALRGFLETDNVDCVEIQQRIKTFESLIDKAESQKLDNPSLSDIKDICGLRIVHYYESDAHIIGEIIRHELDVLETEDKSQFLMPDQFGYRSLHYIVRIPAGWLSAPNYRGLDGLVAEIQVRTILMHAWAAINHKLSYKKKEDIPSQFTRSLFMLSALVELADQQFDILRQQRTDYIDSLVKTSDVGKSFDLSAALNVDSLKALLNFLCPGRIAVDKDLSVLAAELRVAGIELKDIYDAHTKAKEHQQEIEQDWCQAIGAEYNPDKPWHQTGYVRTILNITSDKYSKKIILDIPRFQEFLTKWRKILRV